MNVSLTPTLEKLVQDKVTSGLYTSASEVIREALRMMAENDQLHHAKLSALREDLDVGIRQLENGKFEEYDKNSTHQLIERIKSKRKK